MNKLNENKTHISGKKDRTGLSINFGNDPERESSELRMRHFKVSFFTCGIQSVKIVGLQIPSAKDKTGEFLRICQSDKEYVLNHL
jgi:hypothetical protein